MREDMTEDMADKQIYCRLLGHDVPFSYCERPGSNIFCRNIISCWEGKMDIRSRLAENYTDKEIAEALKPRPPKMESLIALIQKAKENTGGGNG